MRPRTWTTSTFTRGAGWGAFAVVPAPGPPRFHRAMTSSSLLAATPPRGRLREPGAYGVSSATTTSAIPMPPSGDARALPASAETPLSPVFDGTASSGSVGPRPASGFAVWAPTLGAGAPAAHAAQPKKANHPARRSTAPQLGSLGACEPGAGLAPRSGPARP